MVCVLWYTNLKTCYTEYLYSEQVSFYTEYTLNRWLFILSIRWTCIILYWVYAEHSPNLHWVYASRHRNWMPKCFFTLSIRWTGPELYWVYAEPVSIYTEYTLNRGWNTLSIRWTVAELHWVYADCILSIRRTENAKNFTQNHLWQLQKYFFLKKKSIIIKRQHISLRRKKKFHPTSQNFGRSSVYSVYAGLIFENKNVKKVTKIQKVFEKTPRTMISDLYRLGLWKKPEF